jgi:sec-independent protein translocase protein TatA
MGLGQIGFSELIVIFLIVLLLFGARRLPEIGKSLGSGIREFKKAAKEIQREASVDDEQRKGDSTDSQSGKPPSTG